MVHLLQCAAEGGTDWPQILLITGSATIRKCKQQFGAVHELKLTHR